ncbi:hypothetical protein ACLOJK_020322 [Asimina triloba]
MYTYSKDISAGGIDTSAVTMQWALAEILNNPVVFRKVREEIESVVGTKRLVQESDAPNLSYVQAVVKETLRMHPADCTVGGFFMPKGTNIFINAWSIGRDPEYWDDPHLFRPERFLDSNAAVDFKGQHFQYLPFGSGPRMCQRNARDHCVHGPVLRLDPTQRRHQRHEAQLGGESWAYEPHG